VAGGGQEKGHLPGVSLIVSAFATLADVRGTLTPQLDATEADTTLVLVDLGQGARTAWAAACWSRLNQTGCTDAAGVPDLDEPQTW
jgi:phosphoribosylformylglycinamidine synthase